MPTIAELHAKLNAARTAHAKTGAAVTRAYKAWEKAVRAERANIPIGIAEALEVYLIPEGLENEVGAQLDNERGRAVRNWLNEWTMPRGIHLGGHHYEQTLQEVVKVALNHKWGKDKLAVVAEMLVGLLPIIRPGGLAQYDRRGKPTPPTERDAWKVFDIFEHSLSDDGDFRLVYRPDETWAVYDARRFDYSFGRKPMVEGDLMTVLEYIRAHLWYEGGPRRFEEDFGFR